MKSFTTLSEVNLDSIPIDSFWNTSAERESKMHKIHAYPAKFPAFITTKALELVSKSGITPQHIADVFCGCGTVAFEAKRNNINFWGCDINPVATMIAKTKSRNYKPYLIQGYYDSILKNFDMCNKYTRYEQANERLQYWYDKKQFEELARLKQSIIKTIPPKSNYLLFFLCAFSNILKPTSKWLTKSIKPQIDPNKTPADVITVFKKQCQFMMRANEENDNTGNSTNKIITANFLDKTTIRPNVDMIITSPPYVTSYEYADLHQLSSLWLNYAEDYRTLRKGSIGSFYHDYNFNRELKRLNSTGASIVFRLLEQDKSTARSVAKYFLDMQQVTRECSKMLTEKGIALFIIGNTEYKGVRIDNARHLCESLLSNGFHEVNLTKRKITGKILTPYRDKEGRFSKDKNNRKIYSEEFIVIGRKQ